jgi:hypothetical protein
VAALAEVAVAAVAVEKAVAVAAAAVAQAAVVVSAVANSVGRASPVPVVDRREDRHVPVVPVAAARPKVVAQALVAPVAKVAGPAKAVHLSQQRPAIKE